MIIDEIFAGLAVRFNAFIGWFTDPFWGWLWVLVGLYFVCLLVCYFFGSWFPTLRAIAGVMLLIATFGLFAFAKGERAAREHDRRR